MTKRNKRAPAKRRTPRLADGELSEKERRFVEAYMGAAAGNGTEACRIAGYKGSAAVLATTAGRVLRKADIRAAVKERIADDPAVATRKERQRFWTDAMHGKLGKVNVEVKDRLKASELLGKSQADFIERHEHGGVGGRPIAHEVLVVLVGEDGRAK